MKKKDIRAMISQTFDGRFENLVDFATELYNLLEVSGTIFKEFKEKEFGE